MIDYEVGDRVLVIIFGKKAKATLLEFTSHNRKMLIELDEPIHGFATFTTFPSNCVKLAKKKKAKPDFCKCDKPDFNIGDLIGGVQLCLKCNKYNARFRKQKQECYMYGEEIAAFLRGFDTVKLTSQENSILQKALEEEIKEENKEPKSCSCKDIEIANPANKYFCNKCNAEYKQEKKELKLEVGKLYKTRDGRKVYCYNVIDVGIGKVELLFLFGVTNESGLRINANGKNFDYPDKFNDDIIEEWRD